MPQAPPLPPGFAPVESAPPLPPGFKPIAKEQPGFRKRLAEATGFPSSMEELKAAQPSTLEKLGGPAVTVGKSAINYGRNVISEGRQALNMPPVAPTGQFFTDINNAPISRFLLRGLLGPFGGTGVANAAEDISKGNYSGAGGDVLGSLINLLMLKKSSAPSEVKATNKLTAATDKSLRMPIEKSLPELRKSAGQIGLPSGVEEFHSVADNASRKITQEATAAIAPIANRMTMPTAIASAIRGLITRDMGHFVYRGGKQRFVANSPEGLAAARQIEKEAQAFDKPWSYGDLDARRMRLNSELNRFEKKGTGDRYTAKNSNTNIAIDSTIANTIRDIVYPQMDAAAGRPQGYFRALKQKQVSLIELSDELNPRNRESITEKLKGETAVAQGSPRFSRSNISLHAGGKGIPRASLYSLMNVIKKPNPLASANTLVRKGFSTGSPTAKVYTSTLPMRSQLFPVPEEQR